MKKRIIILSLVILVLLGMVAPVAASKPPWSAYVVTPTDDWCAMFWAKWGEGGELEDMTIFGTWSEEYQPRTGTWNESCHLKINFDDPSVLSIKDMCALWPEGFSCSQGTFRFKGFTCLNGDLMTTDSVYLVAPSGESLSSCHFNPKKP